MGLDGKLNFYDGALLLFVLRKAEENISEMFFHDASADSFDLRCINENNLPLKSALFLGFVSIVAIIFTERCEMRTNILSHVIAHSVKLNTDKIVENIDQNQDIYKKT